MMYQIYERITTGYESFSHVKTGRPRTDLEAIQIIIDSFEHGGYATQQYTNNVVAASNCSHLLTI